MFVLATTALAFALFGIWPVGYTVDAMFFSNNIGTKNEKNMTGYQLLFQ